MTQRKFAQYDAFKNYLHIMHEKAVELLDSLDSKSRNYIKNYFAKYAKVEREHYWSLQKLFAQAMFIPVFLQIGRKYFDNLIYVDTHSGPGLAKVGDDERDIVLGSPLLAYFWPDIIAENVKKFQNIKGGFQRLFYIERDSVTKSVLEELVRSVDNENKTKVICGDSNSALRSIKSKITALNRPLVLLFIDPFGGIKTQLSYDTLSRFVRGLPVDIILNVMSPFLARGLSSIRDSNTYREHIKFLFGNLCERSSKDLAICQKLDLIELNIGSEDILTAYKEMFKLLGYKFVDSIAVRHNGEIYNIVFASKAGGASKWLRNYIEYLRTRMPPSYKQLKDLWLQATGRKKSITDFF